MRSDPERKHDLGRRSLAQHISRQAQQLGFDLVGIASVSPRPTFTHYQAWIKSGNHGAMAYLARPDAVEKRRNPALILPGARSVVTVGINYYCTALPAELRDDLSRGIISSYAWGEDYHDLMLPRLRQLSAYIQEVTGQPVAQRAYVDTGPLLERDMAHQAGLGFVGKNTNLIHPRLGSWLFLGEILLAAEIPAMKPLGEERGTCGACTRCLDACPTAALVAPYVLDARRCISYLTIELKGWIPVELRPLIGNRIFGCDICQEVCPWNRRFAQPTAETAFLPQGDIVAPRLLELMTLSQDQFRARFQNSPVKRAKRQGLLRNVAVSLGNWGDPAAVPVLIAALGDGEALIRGHAAWALGRIGGPQTRQALREALSAEPDEQVRLEMGSALESI